MDLPKTFQLSQNFPNPFNSTTQIAYQLPQGNHVLINIYNVNGQHVKTLVDENKEPGTYFVVWDGINAKGTNEASGVYIVSLQTTSFMAVRKMILLK